MNPSKNYAYYGMHPESSLPLDDLDPDLRTTDADAPETHPFQRGLKLRVLQNRMDSKLGTDLRQARRLLRMTQTDLAAKAGCSVLSVRQAETGRGMLPVFLSLAAACGVEIEARWLPPGGNLGARLLTLRGRMELGRRAAAQLAGTSATTVAAIESGAPCHMTTVVRLAQALGAHLRLMQPGAVGFWQGAATSSAYHGWTTPLAILEALYPVVGGRFGLDPCSPVRRGAYAPVRAQVRFTATDHALERPWRSPTVFMNPPFGRTLGAWVAKARNEHEAGHAGFVVGLVPARTDTRWWHEYVAGAADTWLLRGRLSFGDGSAPAPFPSAIVAWGATGIQRTMITDAFANAWHVCKASRRLPVAN